VTFKSLDQDVIARVADKMLGELEIQLADRNVMISYTDAARRWIAQRGYDKLFGARPMARLIDEHIKGKLVDELLFGSLEKGGAVKVDVENEELVFAFESDAGEPPPETPKKPVRELERLN
jgi:ATP-dependent Clp protease ATP-binding subunit ClpA